MKQLTLTISFAIATLFLSGQAFNDYLYTLTFENPSLLNHVFIPTNSSNKWQIGAPQKTVFTSAFSPTNVIVTDKSNPYPINDTSIFIIKNIANAGLLNAGGTTILSGKYFVNSDTISDFGKIEFSPNNGTTWVDLINTTTYSNSIFWTFKPTLTGNSNIWKDFYVNISQLGPLFNIQNGDTVLYKFTFISDNTQSNKDGLMYDDLHFEDYLESIPEIQNDNLISIFPNPTSDLITINEIKKGSRPKIEIFDFTGHLVFVDKKFSGQTISTKALPSGVYFLKYSDSNSYATKKIVVRH